ncbi:MAG: hypothetical protein ACKOXR_02215 [Bacteroidota bacterium]
MFRALTFLLTATIGFANPAIAQYGGQDTTQTPTTAPTPEAKNEQGRIAPKSEGHTALQIHPIQKEAMTFLWTNNSDALVNTIGKGLQSELETNFGNVGNSIVTKKPTSIGYQYHFRDRWTMGVQYTWAEVKSDTLAYPDFDRINQYSYFQYVVKLNSFLASIDYAWKIKNTPKMSYALYSGIALGNSRIDYNTVRMNYDSSSSYIPAFNGGVDMNGFQVTLIGIKQHFRGLRNFGYHAELGVGINSIGLAYGLTYTL